MCGENEYIPECIPCPPLNCGDRNDTVCTAECRPNKECYCRPGFLRNKQGVCVKQAECGEYWIISNDKVHNNCVFYSKR